MTSTPVETMVSPADTVAGGITLTTAANAAAATTPLFGRTAPLVLPDFAPVPAEAFGPRPNGDGYYVGRISGELYWITDGLYQAMFLSTCEGVVLVDAPPTIGRNLQRAIDDVTRVNGRPGVVTHLVYSHSHADHIGAAGLFGDDVVRIGHRVTRDLLLRDDDPDRPAPRVVFQRRRTLEVGGERLELAFHGPNHSPDNIFVHAPEHRTLMVVDVVYPGWVPFRGLAGSPAVPDWFAAHDVALGYDWTTLVGGHLGRLGVRRDALVQKEYLADLASSAAHALTTVDPTPYFRKYNSTGNAWAIFKTYLSRVAEVAAAPVAAKYAGVLAAADVFTVDNAAALLASQRIDAGILGPFSVRP